MKEFMIIFPPQNNPRAFALSRSIFSSTISFVFGLTGPSYTTDAACASSLIAFENAYHAIKSGKCDAAIVGGASLCLLPQTSKWFNIAGVLSSDGRCKAWDKTSDGYVRSEAASALFLQKAKDAKRIYATVVNAQTNNDGFKVQSMTYPSGELQAELMKSCYDGCKLSPSCVKYIEAHGTGTRAGDPEEIKSIDQVFCKNIERSEPLLIGTVKSNLGHSEGASGMVSIIKVLLCMESGVIYPNLHFNEPRPDLLPIVEGKMKVVTETVPCESEYIGVNSFGMGGSNCHIILKSNGKEKINGGAPSDGLPRLICVSGRTEEAVQTILDDLRKKPVDAEYVKLLHDIHNDHIAGHLCRGYILLDNEKVGDSQPPCIQPFDEGRRPIWYVFSGMGSQWPGMGEALLRLPIFSESVRKCDAVLKPHGFDIYEALTRKDESKPMNILEAMVGAIVIQLGLVDVLNSLGLRADNVIGHSSGETPCAYADGSLSLEQAVMTAYYRGLVGLETDVINGTMAAVGLGYKELKNRCPAEIAIACHNSSTSSTISGPTHAVEAFMLELQAEGIFTKKVLSDNIPYHSRYIQDMGPKYSAYLKKIIPIPKRRTEIWLSSSIPENEWDTPLAQFSSADYFTNSLLKPVLFEEIMEKIPMDAILIEIAPHGILQAILKRSLGPQVTNVSLTLRNHPDCLNFLLENLGKLYNLGVELDLAKLYPDIQYPVSRGTQSISHLIKWEHSQNWPSHKYEYHEKNTAGERFVFIDTRNSEYSSLVGHVIDGRNLFPATGHLFLVWETFSMMNDKHFSKMPVLFKDVQFLRATNLPKEGEIILRININIGTGRFEVAESKTTVASGFVFDKSHPNAYLVDTCDDENGAEEILTNDDIYKRLKLKGCDYTGVFRSTQSCSLDGTKGHIRWRNDWIAFLDNLLQISSFNRDASFVQVPVRLEEVFIDPIVHYNCIESSDQDTDFETYGDPLKDMISSKGVRILGIKTYPINRRRQAVKTLCEEYKFVPYMDGDEMDTSDIIRMITQIVHENHFGTYMEFAEFINDSEDTDNMSDFMCKDFAAAIRDIPEARANMNVITVRDNLDDDLQKEAFNLVHPKDINTLKNLSIVIGCGLLKADQAENLHLLTSKLELTGFVASRESTTNCDLEKIAQDAQLQVIMRKVSGEDTFYLLRKKNVIVNHISVIKVSNEDFGWVEEMKRIMSETLEKKDFISSRVLFVSEGDFDSGLLGYITCLNREIGREIIRGITIQDPSAEKFSLDNLFYAEHLAKDLTLSVLRHNGVWGTYRHFPIAKQQPEEVYHILAEQSVPGDLSSFRWIQGPIHAGSGSIQPIRVVYSSINFKDIMLATGKLSREYFDDNGKNRENFMGFEFSGYNSAGERVMGISKTTSFSNLLPANGVVTVPVPESWTLEDSATVFVAYTTAYYALHIRGGLKARDKVLIHAGSGAVGQAAIRLAIHEGCEVFTTVGTPEKREFIRNHFPQIKDDHIGNSRDTSFLDMIKKNTNGLGVDVVLNSLAEEKLLASVKCLAPGGRFLEIGRYDLSVNNPLGLEAFLKDISFHGVMLDRFMYNSDGKMSGVCQFLLDGVKTGAVKPLVRTVFAKDDMETALRYVANGKHIGKVILKVQDHEEILEAPVAAVPRYYCSHERSYVILGGLGGVGLELVDWLISRGAKFLVLSSRTGSKSGYEHLKLKRWQEHGAQVLIITGKDASIYEDCRFILESAMQLAPIDGIFNLAVVMKDSIWENQTPQYFESAFAAKVRATKNLDTLSRIMCPSLRHFVAFSSTVSGRGYLGLSNYGMANSAMERICERRVLEGLPGLAIQWGPIGDVGIFSKLYESNLKKKSQHNIREFGYTTQSLLSMLEDLDKFMNQKKAVVSCVMPTLKKSKQSTKATVMETVMSILGLKDLTGVSISTPLAEMGMDSMVAVELKQAVEMSHGIFLNIQDLRTLTIKDLQKMSGTNATQTEIKIESALPKKSINPVFSYLKDLLFGAELCKSEEFDSTPALLRLNQLEGREIVLIPGVSGLSSDFNVLKESLKTAATCLQLGLNKSDRNIQDMAARFSKDMHHEIVDKKGFVLIGYDFGSLLAIEIARFFEQMGLQGKLILIDGAPLYSKRLVATNNQNLPNDDLQNQFSSSLISLSPLENLSQLEESLKDISEWEDKLQTYLNLHSDIKMSVPIDTGKNCIEAMYNRFKAVMEYEFDSSSKLRGPITLIKPTIPSIQFDNEDYGLSQVTEGQISILYADGDHVTMLEDEKIAAVINQIAQDTSC
ncbi:hypothetical protein QAD02_010049 [Eretmocerus hayati]|uniref:Uncharacterized protein n=1 Tax=Eretmocerus hayati TaxID=131215 RepID=A0ACC2NBW2_9HYME|nr:hypothetical protein QAD02_010049 [Eretmocerus hayati]